MNKQEIQEGIRTCFLHQENGTCNDCLCREEGNCDVFSPAEQIGVRTMRKLKIKSEDPEDKGKMYYIDIPNSSTNPEDTWVNVAEFPNKNMAVAFVKKTFGGDEEGRVSLITEVSHE